MFHRRMTGTNLSDEDSARYPEVMATYRAFLESLDLSRAGDLLLFFGTDFFHDAGITAFSALDSDGCAQLELTAWIDAKDDPDDEVPSEIHFRVRFESIAWAEVQRDPRDRSALIFLYSEIDGLDERLADARREYSGEFHSLAIQCLDAWIALVFRSVSVSPVDPVLWARVMRDPRAEVYLYGLNTSS